MSLASTGCQHRHLSPLGFVWTLPNTLIGVVFSLLSGALPRPHGGLLVASSNRGLAWLFLTRRGFGAITLGRVVVSATPLNEHLLMHEAHHVWQYERLGPFFLPLYLWRHARRGYWQNPYEIEAEKCAVDWRDRV
jgi:hypothetical protein